MSAGQRYPYEFMRHIAGHLHEYFAPVVTLHDVAGSVRRFSDAPSPPKDATCGDIELVFDAERSAIMQKLMARGDKFKNVSGGERLVKCTYHPGGRGGRNTAIPVQLNFATVLNTLEWGTLSNYGWKLVLATGDWEWNRLLVTDRRHGGLKPANITKADGGPTSGFLHRGLIPQSTPTEESVFELLGIPFVPPHRRNGVTAREIRARLVLERAL